MLRNYFKIAIRNLLRNKFYSFITIFGLAIGIACFVLIFMFIKDELSYDRYHTNAHRIFRVTGELDPEEGQGEESSSCPFPVALALKNDYPHLIEHTVRFFNFQEPFHTLQYGDKKINEKRTFYVDSTVFKVFDFPLEKGDPEKALAEPNSIVITREISKKYFGDTDPVGKIIRFDGIKDLMVTGVFAEIPKQSHFQFDCLVSFSTLFQIMGPNMNKNWIWNPCWTYLLLKENSNPAELEKQFPAFINKYYPEFIKPQVKHVLQPLTGIHLNSDLDYEIEPNGSMGTIYIFGAIGLFILLIAGINFMNLATARSANRAKETGIRKVAGASRIQLILQFLSESVLLSFIAVILAMMFVELLLPVFNNISGKQLTFTIFSDSQLLSTLLIVGLLSGVLSGLYPAFFLSSFEPISVLKGNLRSGASNKILRKGLVVTQFSISLVLIISTVLIYKQLNFLRTANLGFKKDNVLVIPVKPPMAKVYKPLVENLRNNRHISGVCTMNEIIGAHHNTHEYNYEGMKPGQ